MIHVHFFVLFKKNTKFIERKKKLKKVLNFFLEMWF